MDVWGLLQRVKMLPQRVDEDGWSTVDLHAKQYALAERLQGLADRVTMWWTVRRNMLVPYCTSYNYWDADSYRTQNDVTHMRESFGWHLMTRRQRAAALILMWLYQHGLHDPGPDTGDDYVLSLGGVLRFWRWPLVTGVPVTGRPEGQSPDEFDYEAPAEDLRTLRELACENEQERQIRRRARNSSW